MRSRTGLLSLLLCFGLASGVAYAGGDGGGDGDNRSDREIIEDAIDDAVPHPPYADTDKDITEDHKKKWDDWHEQRNRRRQMADFADDWSHAFQNGFP